MSALIDGHVLQILFPWRVAEDTKTPVLAKLGVRQFHRRLDASRIAFWQPPTTLSLLSSQLNTFVRFFSVTKHCLDCAVLCVHSTSIERLAHHLILILLSLLGSWCLFLAVLHSEAITIELLSSRSSLQSIEVAEQFYSILRLALEDQ